VDWQGATWNQLPYKLEAGTPPIAEAIGLGAAAEYLDSIGLADIAAHTQALTEQCVATLEGMEGLTVHGPRTGRLGPVAFSVDGVHPHDVASWLDLEGVAVRAGHHCAQPLHSLLGVPATARASFYITNNEGDIERLAAGLRVVQKAFAPCSATSIRRSSLTTTGARRTRG
jgi:cysteine desulfurase/selenocysteine lyase